mmetsp:Transcript_59859/g.131317  ORF Transcript_59859/g.131317 Transcript_59859/m.131317 type:complete len:215 (-) Transcript_59859:79-723(-)
MSVKCTGHMLHHLQGDYDTHGPFIHSTAGVFELGASDMPLLLQSRAPRLKMRHHEHTSFLFGTILNLFGGQPTGPESAGQLVPAYTGDWTVAPVSSKTAAALEQRTRILQLPPIGAPEETSSQNVAEPCLGRPQGWHPGRGRNGISGCYWGSSTITPGDFPPQKIPPPLPPKKMIPHPVVEGPIPPPKEIFWNEPAAPEPNQALLAGDMPGKQR